MVHSDMNAMPPMPDVSADGEVEDAGDPWPSRRPSRAGPELQRRWPIVGWRRVDSRSVRSHQIIARHSRSQFRQIGLLRSVEQILTSLGEILQEHPLGDVEGMFRNPTLCHSTYEPIVLGTPLALIRPNLRSEVARDVRVRHRHRPPPGSRPSALMWSCSPYLNFSMMNRIRCSQPDSGSQLSWATKGDEVDGVAGRDSAADGLHAASIHEVDDGFPAIAGIIVEQTFKLRRAGVVAQAFAGVVTEGYDLVIISMLGESSGPRPAAR